MQPGTWEEKIRRHGIALFAAVFFLFAIVCAAVRVFPFHGAREPVQTTAFTVAPKPDGDVRTRFLSETFSLKKGIYTVQYDATVPVETEVVAGEAQRLTAQDGADDSRGILCMPLRVPGGTAHREFRIHATRDTETAVLVREYYEGNGVPQAEVAVSMVYRPLLTMSCYVIDTLLCFAVLFLLFLSVRHIALHREQREACIPLLLFFLTAVISLPLFRDYVTVGHDTVFHVRRIASLAEELFSGRIPVRLSQTWKNGYGYPVSIFYGDLLILPAAVLFRLGVPLFRCYQLCAVFMNALTVLLSYHCFLKLSGKRWTAAVLSTMYAGSVRYAANLYLRGAIGEDMGMALLPLAVTGFYELARGEEQAEADPDGRRRALICLVLSFSALLQVHTLTTIQAALFAFLFCLANIRMLLRGRRLFTLLCAAGITLLLNLWFLVPFADYYTRHSFYAKLSLPVAETAVSLRRLLVPEEAFKAIGAGTLLLLVLCAAVILWRRRMPRGAWPLPVLSVLAVWMGTTLFPWTALETHLPFFYGLIGGRMQYVWRYFSIATLLVCVTAALVSRTLSPDTEKQKRAGVAVSLLLLCVTLGGSLRVQYESLHPDEERYVLRAADVWNGDGGDALYMFDDLYWYNVPAETILAEEGISYANVSREGTSFTFDAENKTAEDLRIALPVWNYHGYMARGTSDGMADLALQIKDGEDHRVSVVIPASFSGTITVGFREPWYWRVSEFASLATGILAVVFLLRHRKKTAAV